MMPNWENATEYEFTRELTQEGWAWEFLRRNPEYRGDYSRSIEMDTLWEAEGSRFNNEHAMFDPERFQGESILEWSSRIITTKNVTPMAYKPSMYFGNKWHLRSTIQNPNVDSPPAFKIPHYPDLLSYHRVEQHFEKEIFEGEVMTAEQVGNILIVCFDLEQPLTYQIEALKEFYREENRRRELDKPQKGTRLCVERKTLILRFLDSSIAGVRRTDFCRHALPDTDDEHDFTLAQDAAYRLNKQAEELCAPSGYMRFLSKPKP